MEHIIGALGVAGNTEVRFNHLEISIAGVRPSVVLLKGTCLLTAMKMIAFF